VCVLNLPVRTKQIIVNDRPLSIQVLSSIENKNEGEEKDLWNDVLDVHVRKRVCHDEALLLERDRVFGDIPVDELGISENIHEVKLSDAGHRAEVCDSVKCIDELYVVGIEPPHAKACTRNSFYLVRRLA
jgi:hypothetical protein